MAESQQENEQQRRKSSKVAVTKKHLRRDQTIEKRKSRVPGLSDNKAQKLKEEKEAKRASLDARHQYIFASIATKLSLEDTEVEDFILEGDQLKMMEDFFAANGPNALMFFFKETQQKSSDGKLLKPMKELYITDGTKDAFTGMCLFFVRSSSKALTTSNIADVSFGVLESKSGGILEAIGTLIKSVFVPALKEQTNWGELSKDASGHVTKENFLGKLDGFVSILANAQTCVANSAQLSPCAHDGVNAIRSPSEAIAAAGVPEVLEGAEKCALAWCKEIEQVNCKFVSHFMHLVSL
jgi:dynein heavy chain